MLFYSQEWVDAVKAKSETDEVYQRKSKGLTGKVFNVVTDYPGGIDIAVEWDMDDGKIMSVTREEKPAPSDFRDIGPDPDYLSRAAGSYQAWSKMDRREITPMQAMATKIYKVHSDMTKIMPKMGQFTALTELQGSIDCDY